MRVGLLVEGGIDEEILPPLLEQLLTDIPEHRRRGIDYLPVLFPPNGYGKIPKDLKVLVRLYQDEHERQRIGCDLFIVVLDSRKTDNVQKEIKKILQNAPDFPSVYGLAIQETEAWVLGDIDHVNKKLFHIHPAPRLAKAPERDTDPKKTLTDIFIRPSASIEYDCWNRDCARMVAPYLRQEQVAVRCRLGFGSFAKGLKKFVSNSKWRFNRQKGGHDVSNRDQDAANG
jgi:hypothetical protein